jgi:hypothetical protein
MTVRREKKKKKVFRVQNIQKGGKTPLEKTNENPLIFTSIEWDRCLLTTRIMVPMQAPIATWIYENGNRTGTMNGPELK